MAVCARTLEGIYHDAGYPEEASRYGELSAKYENRSSEPKVGGFGEAPFTPALSPALEQSLESGVKLLEFIRTRGTCSTG